jgi:hypothetical protein
MSHLIRLTLLLLFSAASVCAQDAGRWPHYENDDFSLSYPNTWELTEENRLIKLSYADYALNILRDELRIGLPAGDFERRKLIGAYGIPVDVLVYDGKIKQVLYGRLEGPGTMLSIVLAAPQGADIAYEDITIPPSVVEEANQIVSTLRLHAVQQPADVMVVPFFSGEHNPIDAWQTYAHPTEPFAFRYPPGWTLQEEAGRIVLVRDRVRFTIAYAPSTAQPPMVNPQLWNSEHLEVRASIYGLHQAVQSEVVDPQADGTAVGVIYHPILTPDNHFVLWVSGEPLLNPATMDKVDLIISTFKTRPFQQGAQFN